MPKKYWKFDKGDCELIHSRTTLKIHSIIIMQKCKECGLQTGLGYYSHTGKERKDRLNQKCKKCLQKALDQACKDDKSHMEMLSN